MYSKSKLFELIYTKCKTKHHFFYRINLILEVANFRFLGNFMFLLYISHNLLLTEVPKMSSQASSDKKNDKTGPQQVQQPKPQKREDPPPPKDTNGATASPPNNTSKHFSNMTVLTEINDLFYQAVSNCVLSKFHKSISVFKLSAFDFDIIQKTSVTSAV